jgi:hypothetical protein
MSGTVKLVDGQLLLFSFPYSPEANSALRDVTDNRVHWDPKLRGFTLSADRLRSNAAMVTKLTRFIGAWGLDADPGIRKLLAFRMVKATSLPAASCAWRPPSTRELGPGRLRCDLLPASTWGSNLRGVFSRRDWDLLRIPVCTAAGDVCEVCGSEAYTDDGRKRRPDCHELWIFEHRNGRNVQRLDRLIALCLDCHRAQHIGLAGVNDETDLVIAKLCEVNAWTTVQATIEMNRAWAEYEHRQRYHWDLDLSALCDVVTIDGYPDLYFPAEERDRLGNSYYR